MTVEMLKTLSTASYIAAGVTFLFAIALFFLLDIPRVIGELTGRTARKSIQEIQKHNAGNSGSARLSSHDSHATKPGKTGRVGVGTEKFNTAALNTQSNETTLLQENMNETTLLQENVNETTLLSGNEAAITGYANTYETTLLNMTVTFELIEEISSYLDNEIIE